MVLAAALITDLHLVGPGASSQCFSFYTYDEEGTNRRENVTDWAQEHFGEHYKDEKITKWDIFYYVYGVLHHPEYRSKYIEDLKRELPRIPLAKDFWGFSKAGKELARLHIDYENLEPWPLKFIETSSLVLGADVAASLPRHGGVKAAVTKCRPQGRRYDPALLSRGRQDAAGKRPPLAQGERFLDAGRHSTRDF